MSIMLSCITYTSLRLLACVGHSNAQIAAGRAFTTNLATGLYFRGNKAFAWLSNPQDIRNGLYWARLAILGSALWAIGR